ncbi:hypothetical protein FIA58_009300 [Flavobacterium jejuense]|uniref:DUF2231 domain-containing protein n=1 Tax=Flavobacterium jejuense TaxID=1544455 RepID=A0ABX0IVM7_9FLAO|nr:DUF2231 domain-containing protein [Flavobacterium jejuense]NHN25869.1 hypothetical protein [Flavobacterium jejuense]
MNDAHLHMVINHFPIIGLIFGTGILLVGIVLKNKSVQNTAFLLLAIAAIFGFASMATGEGAEEMVEDLPNIGHKIIHEHEELAEKFVLFLYATGLLGLISFYLNLKNNSKVKFVMYATLGVAILTCVFAKSVGTSGGEIRHTEIRETNNQLNNAETLRKSTKIITINLINNG